MLEFDVEGLATALPFHRAVVDDPAFAPTDPSQPFDIHTRWIETEFDNTIAPHVSDAVAPEVADRERVTVEVGGKRLEVTLLRGSAMAPTGYRPPANRRRDAQPSAVEPLGCPAMR